MSWALNNHPSYRFFSGDVHKLLCISVIAGEHTQ
jgi:hypothetical protein